MRGIRIVDFSRVLAGPWAAQQLADQGAEVVKVEPPGGDETRRFVPHVEGEATYFLAVNRNKRSIELDLRTEAGRDVAARLVATADVVLQNWRPGVAERLGLDWKTLHERHPDLVYVAIHAFGDEGDPRWVRRPGYDLVMQAMGGGMSFTGFPGTPPVRAGTPVADLTAGMLAVQAVLFGLLHRERGGGGQKVVVNMLQAQHATLVYHVTRQTLTGEAEEPRGNQHGGLVPYDVYRCADGWIALACGNDALWQRLRTCLELPDEPPWRTNEGRVAHRHAVNAAIEVALGALSVDEADRRLEEAGVPAGPVLDVGEVVAHPAAHVLELEHPRVGTVRVQGPPLRTATTRAAHRAPPDLGEHRSELLRELGFGQDDEQRLSAGGAFGTTPAASGDTDGGRDQVD